MVNNLNDGMAWGLFPLFFAATNLSVERIALLAAIGDVAHPSWRASAVGVSRLWRDAGYAFGALLAGVGGSSGDAESLRLPTAAP